MPLTGNSKLYLGKIYNEEQINKLNTEDVEKLFGIYEAKYNVRWLNLWVCTCIPWGLEQL